MDVNKININKSKESLLVNAQAKEGALSDPNIANKPIIEKSRFDVLKQEDSPVNRNNINGLSSPSITQETFEQKYAK